jgi:GNAT superfamily N-acetyltransferase
VEVLAALDLGSESVILRRAEAGDVRSIVDLIAADQLGATRDGARTPGELAAYQRAFAAIDADPAHILVVAESGHDIVATLQLSFIPGLARRGALRAQVEAVRVQDAYRGRGLGAAMLTWAIGEARRRGCALVQLTTDKSRTGAHRFYQRLGFVASHEGMKLILNGPPPVTVPAAGPAQPGQPRPPR